MLGNISLYNIGPQGHENRIEGGMVVSINVKM